MNQDKIDARAKLVRVEQCLFLQVAGDNNYEPLIEGGYDGLNYRNALGCIINCILLLEVDMNLEAIKAGEKQPFPYSWRYLSHRS